MYIQVLSLLMILRKLVAICLDIGKEDVVSHRNCLSQLNIKWHAYLEYISRQGTYVVAIYMMLSDGTITCHWQK